MQAHGETAGASGQPSTMVPVLVRVRASMQPWPTHRYRISKGVAHVQRSDGWIQTTWNNMSDPGAFAAAGAEEHEGGGGEPAPLAGAGVVVCVMG